MEIPKRKQPSHVLFLRMIVVLGSSMRKTEDGGVLFYWIPKLELCELSVNPQPLLLLMLQN